MQMLIRWLACFFFCMFLLTGCQIVSVVNTTDQLEVEFSLEKDEIAFTYFDLPSGEATLIQSGQGGTVLINTGHPSSQVELAKKLHMYHVDDIDSLIITNHSEEYSGNIQWLADHYQISSIIVPQAVKGALEDNLIRGKEKLTGWKEGEIHEILPGLKTEVLFTGGSNDYEAGLVLLFSYGEHRTLYMGIANAEVEELLTSKYDLKSTILKVGDFGSSYGTSQQFLEKVDPQVAILFTLKGKRPSEYVLERLQETWIDVYQTNKMGAVSIKCTPENYEIWTVRASKQDFKVASSNK
ncbi:ComEC/Rec2 family competence protein [Alkalihalobacillus sp. BA299]|uniref:ComEC/Rec2 family competence protein n=1 Tax=Alkalihalobacillus sp. BA299 TaxID=2815938 RepID=UPI001ADBAB09|nr:MBL fold metallo-hydrolase [Alkalihalobacillus sp. BA299]